MRDRGRLRPLTATERERLLGFNTNHTRAALTRSEAFRLDLRAVMTEVLGDLLQTRVETTVKTTVAREVAREVGKVALTLTASMTKIETGIGKEVAELKRQNEELRRPPSRRRH